MSFEQKYLKYKNKYLNLKNKLGGARVTCGKCWKQYDPDAGEICNCNIHNEGRAAATEYFESLKIGQKFHILNKEKINIGYIEITKKVRMDIGNEGPHSYPTLFCQINYTVPGVREWKNADAALTFCNALSGEPFGTILVHANNREVNLMIPNLILGSEIK